MCPTSSNYATELSVLLFLLSKLNSDFRVHIFVCKFIMTSYIELTQRKRIVLIKIRTKRKEFARVNGKKTYSMHEMQQEYTRTHGPISDEQSRLTLWRGARRGCCGREQRLHVQLHKHKGSALCTKSTRGSKQHEQGEQPAAMAAGRSHGATGLIASGCEC